MIDVFIQIVACKLQNLFSVIYDLLRGKKKEDGAFENKN